MIALDTNVLVYAHRADSSFHTRARDRVASLAQGAQLWAIPWPCIHEFLCIATHSKIFKQPTPTAQAFEQVRAWMEAPNLRLLAEGDGYAEVLAPLLAKGHLKGPQIHDARIAALCLYHSVTVLWSADRDFNRFPSLRVTNPLMDE